MAILILILSQANLKHLFSLYKLIKVRLHYGKPKDLFHKNNICNLATW